MSDIDSNGSWGNAMNMFEEQRPDLAAPPEGRLTARGTCASCGAEGVGLYRVNSENPDTCTACRGPVR